MSWMSRRWGLKRSWRVKPREWWLITEQRLLQQVCRWYRTGSSGWYAWGLCCHPEEHWQPGGTLRSSTKGTANSCAWRGTTSAVPVSVCPGGSQLESRFAEEALGMLTDTQMPLWPAGPAVSWSTSEGALLAGQERASFPLTQPWWGHSYSAMSSPGFPSSTREILERVKQRAMKKRVKGIYQYVKRSEEKQM